jgi:hypothetical protein
MLHYIEHVPSSAAPVRGLIRRAGIRQAGLVRPEEFRAGMEVFVWLAKLLRRGCFRRVGKPLYYRLDHPHSFTRVTSDYLRSEERFEAALTMLFTGLLEAAIPLCSRPEQRIFLQQFILDRIVAIWPSSEPASFEKIITKCLERLRFECNTNLLSPEELPTILQQLKTRPDTKILERSRMRRLIYRTRKRSRMARVIYPSSRMRRVIYQIRQFLKELRNKINELFVFG